MVKQRHGPPMPHAREQVLCEIGLLFRRFDLCHLDSFGFSIHLTCYADLLSGKFASLLLSSVIQRIDNLMRAISKDKLRASVNALECARLIVPHFHRRMIQAAHAVADISDDGYI